MSRGSRSSKSRLKPLLQPFIPLIMSWSGKGEMPSLTAAEPGRFSSFRLTGKALPSAFYINELVMRLLHKHEVQQEIYGLYESVLSLLAEGHSIEPILRLFEKHLLETLGFGLNLQSTADTGEDVLEDLEYAYYLEHGPVELSRIFDEAYVARISGKSLLDLHGNTLEDEKSLRDAKRLMRSVLNYYLGGRPLKSRELFR